LERKDKTPNTQPAKPKSEAKITENNGKAEFQEKKFLSKEQRKIKNRVNFLEKEIAQWEEKQRQVEEKLQNPGAGDDVMDLTREFLENKRQIDHLTDEWMELSEKL
jgi:ATP-binding cassette subfamily F protein 3